MVKTDFDPQTVVAEHRIAKSPEPTLGAFPSSGLSSIRHNVVGGDGYMQNALATLIQEGELKRHLNKAKKIYHQRRNFLDTLLKSNCQNMFAIIYLRAEWRFVFA